MLLQTPEEAAQLKADLCQWEAAFKREHGRKPLKADIDCVPDIGIHFVGKNDGEEWSGWVATRYKTYRDWKKGAQSKSTSKVKSATAKVEVSTTAATTTAAAGGVSKKRSHIVATSVPEKLRGTPRRGRPLRKEMEQENEMPTQPLGNMSASLLEEDEVLGETPVADDKKRKRAKLFDDDPPTVTMSTLEPAAFQSPLKTSLVAANDAEKQGLSRSSSFLSRLQSAIHSPRGKQPPPSTAQKAAALFRDDRASSGTPLHWTLSAKKPSMAMQVELKSSDFPMREESAAQSLRTLHALSQAAISRAGGAVEDHAGNRADEKASSVASSAALRKLKSVLPARKFSMQKSRSSQVAVGDSLMSPPARPSQVHRFNSVEAPGSARKFNTLMFSPSAARTITTEKPERGTEKEDSTPKKGATLDKVEGETNEVDTEKNTNLQKPRVDTDDEAFGEEEQTNKKDGTTEVVEEKKQWKKKPINGRRQTSKRKLRPVDLKEGLVHNKQKGGRMHSAPLKLNRKGRGGRFKVMNHAVVDNGGPMFKHYSSAQALAGVPEENPFDEVFEDTFDHEEVVAPELDDAEANLDEDGQENPTKRDGEWKDVDMDTLLTHTFQLPSFRHGQRECIERIIQRKSTVLVQPTGAGKSLCYQMPAFVLTRTGHNICIVVSPTISLMEDQVRTLPKCLKGACWNSSQSPSETMKLLDRVKNGQVDILYVSPEKLCGAGFIEKFQSPDMPKIAFACIDEVHCLSEWSHNFRPAYFQVKSVLKRNLNVDCVLGLTATATRQTLSSICRLLEIDAERDVIQTTFLRENLKISVSRDARRKQAVAELLSEEPYSNLDGIIIYCLRQSDADEIARYLRTTSSREVESYHAGKEGKDRTRIQQEFLSGKLAVLCATIAFGLGINKSNVRAVIHYSLPKSPENYLQEIGRAGRDGEPAYCHLFLCNDDYCRLKSLAHTDSIDAVTIKKFLERILDEKKVFASAGGKKRGKSGKTVEGKALPGWRLLDIGSLEMDLDMRKSVMITILSYMTLLPDAPIRLMPNVPTGYRLIFYKHKPEDLLQEDDDGRFATIQKHAKRSTAKSDNIWTFDTKEMCAHLDWSPSELSEYLYALQAARKLVVRGDGDSFQYEMLLEKEVLDGRFLQIWKAISAHVAEIERMSLQKVDHVFALMEKASVATIHDPPATAKVEELKASIQRYFQLQDVDKDEELATLVQANHVVSKVDIVKGKLVEGDLQRFIANNEVMSGRAIARIFHALPSPKFPYSLWSRNDFWGRHIDYDFDRIVEMATGAYMRHDGEEDDDEEEDGDDAKEEAAELAQ